MKREQWTEIASFENFFDHRFNCIADVRDGWTKTCESDESANGVKSKARDCSN